MAIPARALVLKPTAETQEMQAMARLEQLLAELRRLRQGYRRDRCLLLGLGGLLLVVSALVILAALDVVLRFPAWICWLVWVTLMGLVLILIVQLVRTARARLSDAAMAVLVERQRPEVKNHLINAVQFAARQDQDPLFVEALLAEIDPQLERMHPKQLSAPRPRRWIMRLLLATLCLGAGLVALWPQPMGHALMRLAAPMAGIQPYTRTRIAAIQPGHTTCLRGAPLTIRVDLDGHLPDTPVVEWDRGRDTRDYLPLQPEPEQHKPRALACRINGVFHAGRYRVLAGDTRSQWYTLGVTHPPGLEHWEAKIIPPEHVGKPAFKLDSTSVDMGVPEGAGVILAGAASAAIEEARILQGERIIAAKEGGKTAAFSLTFTIRDGAPLRLALKDANGLESLNTLPLAVQPDRRPTVILIDSRQRILAAPDAQVPVSFKVEDDYGVSTVGLERLFEGDRVEPVSDVVVEPVVPSFAGRFLLDLASFAAREGDTLRFRVWADDNGVNRPARRGFSPLIQVSIPLAEERRSARSKAIEDTRDRLHQLVSMQRDTLKNTRALADLALLGQQVASSRLQEVQIPQTTIRELSLSLLEDRAALGDLATVLTGLVNHEMIDVLQVMEDAHRANENARKPHLAQCVSLQTRILAQLTGIPMGLDNEQLQQDKTDLFAALQKLIARQRNALKETKAAQAGNLGTTKAAELAANQDQVANDLIAFSDLCLVMVEERLDDDLATQVRAVYDMLETNSTYEKALGAAEALEEADVAAGIQYQEEVLRHLMQALNVLNQWRMRHAQKIAREATEVLRQTAEALAELETKQAQIAEVTRDITRRGVIDDEVREALAEMDAQQKDMAGLVEQLANDLYQFPELPICNELNAKMREIYEEVEQAVNSENAPSVEIAVQKEDSLLDAIRNTKERVEDVEMWLPDIPDNIVWNMESFDTDEFPDIPLVPLPDELEDIVGDLLDQASDIDAQSQDSTGNNIIADMEMGWGVADGPMPSFAAKGKSGNTRPNDNEMTGRSGAGREGQASGELVENHVKGLEGRATHARRTQDPFQKGMVTEDEDSTMDARATGGGKLGGESESIGMFGQAPRRDLHTPSHGKTPTQLRQETEALYATARLLYLGTGSLGTAARELRGVETAREQMKEFGSLHRRVLRRLEDTRIEVNSGVVLPMPVTSVTKTGGAATEDVDISKISEEYRDIVSDYYRSLDAP